ncbi:hypothetical protein IE81DRAFT_285429 [Ceraceosorus guamensis]|uniref:Transcription initiation factor IIE subunit alpha N-terminal domain-containing protein n=1 Tax=Ceraceosorus guamensis TaxID=1522189 RepID=A0A316W6E5_9BASI|nr:hypothetical protein IE81DRAFT_285429 [Ceraceosorus guamensis]PWN45342.1 hypothetical protein IE81DRAFT_285429 [Ceraceosorus guamensis]
MSSSRPGPSAPASTSASTSNPAFQRATREATAEDLAEIRLLLQHVVRQFYEDRHIVVIDRLVKFQVVPADALAGLLAITPKEVTALTLRLVEDGLVMVHRRLETREGGARSFPRAYYYISPSNALNVLKWRLLNMRRTIESAFLAELDTRGFVCPQCAKRFSTLDVAHLLDPTGTALVCDTPGCGAELRDNEDAEDVRRSKDRMKRFNEQLGPALSVMQKVEGVILPPSDPTAWIERYGSTWRQAAAESLKSGAAGFSALPSASSVLPSAADVATPQLSVELSTDDPDSILAREEKKRKEAEAKRKANALPDWLARSTVSGEKTGLDRGADNFRTKGNDEEHRLRLAEAKAKEEQDDCEYYAQYASLQAAEAASGTPNPDEDEGEDEMEEIDVGAPVQTAGAKRSREDEAQEEAVQRRKEEMIEANGSAQSGEEEEEDLDDMEEVA